MATITPFESKTSLGLSVILRSPKVGEGAEILAALQVIMKESQHLLTGPEEFNFTVEQENELIKSYEDHPDKVMIVPVIEGKISGMLNFLPGAKRRISHQGTFGMSVLPKFQNSGVGRIMLDALLDWAKGHPRIEFVRLRVHAKNTNAVHLYRKKGFEEEGREVRGVKFPDGSYDDVIAMVRPVK